MSIFEFVEKYKAMSIKELMWEYTRMNDAMGWDGYAFEEEEFWEFSTAEWHNCLRYFGLLLSKCDSEELYNAKWIVYDSQFDNMVIPFQDENELRNYLITYMWRIEDDNNY